MWKKEMVEILRALINDMAATPLYTDCRLERLLIIAAMYVNMELDFDTTYTINVIQGSISPDPSLSATPRDEDFIGLVCLKAATILLDSEVRYYALGGIRVTDGPSSIDTTARASFVKEAGKVMSLRYNQAKILHQSGQAGTAILTPYTVDTLYPITQFQ